MDTGAHTGLESPRDDTTRTDLVFSTSVIAGAVVTGVLMRLLGVS